MIIELILLTSDPELVCMFIKSLETIFKIDRQRLRVCVHLHDNQKKRKFFHSGRLLFVYH